MPFAATWMDLESVIVKADRGEILHDIPYRWNLKGKTQMNLLRKQKETNRKQIYGCWGWGRESQGLWEDHGHTAIFKTDNHQGPIVQHMKLYSTLCASLDGREIWERMDRCICMAETLCCLSETTITLLTGYTPVQNKKFKVWKISDSIRKFR